MQFTVKFLKFLAVFTLSIFLLPSATQAQHYKQTNLVSNLASITTPNPPDPNLKNPWGLTRSSTGAWWVGNNNSGTSTLYKGTGALVGTFTVPPPNDSPAGTQATPTGVVFNGSSTDFLIAPGQSAHFIFVTEDGTISGWNSGQNAVLVVDNSNNGSPDGAVYKGAT
ncbi:MAG: TIGR03118 family protein, partial [Acidobacteria bacterium]